MPYYHCRKCQHEFEAGKDKNLKCDWCGADKPIVLEEETPLEKMCGNYKEILERLIHGNICERKGSDSDSTEFRRKGRRRKDISER